MLLYCFVMLIQNMFLDTEERGIVVESHGNLLWLFCVLVLYSFF